MIVQDCNANEIKVGTRVRYGVDSLATVTALGTPDILEGENEWGAEIVVAHIVAITIRFDEGDTTEVNARAIYNADWYETSGDDSTVYEEGGDLEVLV